MALLPRIAALAVAVTLFLELTPRRWYDLVDARPLPMASSCWGRRCVLIIAGGALAHALGRRSPFVPSPLGLGIGQLENGGSW